MSWTLSRCISLFPVKLSLERDAHDIVCERIHNDIMVDVQFPYSNGVYLAGAIITFVTSGLSIFGSSSILYLIASRSRRAAKRRKSNQQQQQVQRSSSIATCHDQNATVRQSAYLRFVLGLSISDLLFSGAIFWQPIAMPSSTGLPLASGNVQSCETVGFLMALGSASFFYSSGLSVYFYLTIRNDGKDTGGILTRIEWIVLSVALVFSMSAALISLTTDNINPAPIGFCAIAPYPFGCQGNDCLRGSMQTSRAILLPGVCLMFLVAAIGLVCTWLVYWKVRQKLHQTRRFTFTSELEDSHHRRIRTVAVQAIFYSLAFVNTLVGMVLIIVSFMTHALGISFVIWIILPLQGFFNFFIFVRPQVLHLQKQYPEQSLLWAYKRIFTTASSPSSIRGSSQLKSSASSVHAAGKSNDAFDAAEGGGSRLQDDTLEC